MKKGSVITSLLIGGVLLLQSESAVATMSLAIRCRENFVGLVISVKKPQTPLSSLPKVNVEFQLQTDGDSEKDSQNKTISVAEGGPHKFEVGQVYDVGLNQGFVCRLQRHSS